MAVALDHIETGETTLSNGLASTTATLATAVTTANSILLAQSIVSGGGSDGPANFQVRCELTDTDTLTFTRSGNSGSVLIRWYVIEFSSGVSVQRQTVSHAGTQSNHAITAVDLDTSFVIVNGITQTGSLWGGDDAVAGHLTSTTNARLDTDVSGSTATVAFQVVTYEECAVQRGEVALTDLVLSNTAAITAVDVDKSWLLTKYRTGNGSNIADKSVRGEITDTDTLTFIREGTGNSITVNWELIEFTDATVVQHGTDTLTSVETESDVTITAVDLSKAVATLSGKYMRGGTTATTGAGSPGLVAAHTELSSTTNLNIERGETESAAATFEWFVIEWDAAPSGGGFGALLAGQRNRLVRTA